LTQRQVTKSNLLETIKDAVDRRKILEKPVGFTDLHVENVCDRVISIANPKRLPVKSFSPAITTGHAHVGQKIHIYFPFPMALASLAATALIIEAKATGSEPPFAGFCGCGKYFSNFIEDASVGCRVTARRSTERFLIDKDHFFYLSKSAQTAMRRWLRGHSSQFSDGCPRESFID
jgi:hypothetical protein